MMKKAFILCIFSVLLFSEVMNNKNYRFPDVFMKDNNLAYEKLDKIKIIYIKKETKKETKKEQIAKENSKKLDKIINLMAKKCTNCEKNLRNLRKSIKPMTLIYIAPSFKKRKSLYLVGVSVGFLINDWLNTDFLTEMSMKDNNLDMYDVTNEYSLKILGTKNFRVNILADFSVGGLLDKKTKIEKFFFAYGAGGEIELIMNKVKIVGAYKFEILERKNLKAINSNVYTIKVKFNFPLM
jgi:hypothetical protein